MSETKTELATGKSAQKFREESEKGALIQEENTEEIDTGGLAVMGESPPFLANFSGDRNEKLQLLMKCKNDALKGADHLNKTINLKHWMVHEVEVMEKDSGELNTCYRVVLVDADGTAYAFVSGVLAKSIRDIFQTHGTNVLEPPISVQVKQKSLRGAHRCYVLAPIQATPTGNKS